MATGFYRNRRHRRLPTFNYVRDALDGEAQRQFFKDMLRAYATFRAGESQALKDVLSTQSNIRLSSTALPPPEVPLEEGIPISAQIAELSEFGSVSKRSDEILFTSEDGLRLEIRLHPLAARV